MDIKKEKSSVVNPESDKKKKDDHSINTGSDLLKSQNIALKKILEKLNNETK